MTEKTAATLARFARGEINLEELQRHLTGRVRFRYADTDERAVEVVSGHLPTVRFSKGDIQGVLRRYLRGEITGREASDWAATLRLLDCFALSGSDQEADAVWQVIDELTSPDAWGALTTESAIDLIHRL